MKEITVKTTSFKTSTKSCSELECYKKASAKFGDNNTFLLESLFGPKRDTKASIIGVDAIFGIDIYAQNAKLHGEKKIIDFLLLSLEQSGFTVDQSTQKIVHKNDIWNLLRAIKNCFLVDKNHEYGLSFFGYFTYETIRFIEKIPELIKENYDYPIIALNIFQTFIVYHVNGGVEIAINNSELWQNKKAENYLELLENQGFGAAQKTQNHPQKKRVINKISKENYCKNVGKALKHIALGDIYQIQLGQEIYVESDATPLMVYEKLRARNPSPYMYIANIGGIDLVGASPELYASLKNGVVEMRPIAGTAGKKAGGDNQKAIDNMMQSQKERAEHVMLVDLCRNDISRICLAESLIVDELMVVEEYSHLFHMVSNVKAEIAAGFDAFDVIAATFPAGTMTGAPKIRAMELIEKFETSKRGFYAGAVGIIGFNDTMNTALCIRSTFRQNGFYHLRASAGVVSDSIAENEWMETLYKISSVYYAVTGEELI